LPGKTQTLSALIILALWPEVFAAAAAPVPRNIPADYRAFLEAQAAFETGKAAGVVEGLRPVWAMAPESPLNGRAAVLAARACLQNEKPKDAAAILVKYFARLPQPEGDALTGVAAEAAGDLVTAAAAWQRVYLQFPLSKENVDAEAALVRLRPALGADYPPVMPGAVLERAERLRRAGQRPKARAELLAAASEFSGLERERAMVLANFYDRAALAGLDLKEPEADAERIYLIHAAARRSSLDAEAASSLARLEKKYPASPWTMEALISWGNHWALRNEPAQFVPLLRRCYEGFPQDKQAAYCHWKVTWSAWMAREPGAKKLMEEHATRWPESEKASAALYFSGRYSDCVAKWPTSYYTMLSRRKLGTATQPRAGSAVDASRFTIKPSTKTRIARAKQLEAAELNEWAEFELQYAAEDQPFVAAAELAGLAARRDAHGQALRYVKGLAKGYLSMHFEAAPDWFWKAAFPRPFAAPLEKHAASHGLDPHLVAGLVRQESEFDPNVVSRAKAYGLTQVLPSTGRELYQRLKLGTFRTSLLTDPAVNLQLGTFYLKQLNTSLQGNWEHTLAAYNAGKSRVDRWKTWHQYREPAEFVECIPFNETREYVQVVLRNADIYRRLYGTK